MKKNITTTLAFIICMALFTGCCGDGSLAADTENTLSESEMASAPTANVVNIKEENAIPLAAPRELRTIPEAYYSPAAQQGKLAELTYDTYESKTYEQNAKTLHKRAIVYLPYGYSDSSEYNVFYLMHGGWGNESSTLGTPNQPNQLKNVIDNAIVKGDMKPLIIVCPTYNNESPRDSADFSLALELNRNFHNELVNDLMPAVESTYNTYAKGVTPEELMVSRDHRGFGGFSMGSVATWRTFQNCLDYFRFYLPMSCGTSLGDENIFEAAKNRDPDDYFVWVSTGTKDFAYSYDERRVEKMRESAYFMESTDSATGNFLYLVKEGYSHDGLAAMEYTYNGLCWFWNTDSAIGDLANLSTYTVDTKLSEVTTDKAFGDYGRLIFPVNESYYSGDTLGTLRLTWYNNINPETTVEVANYFKNHAEAGKTIFFDIYTDEEKAKDPAKKDTGLFFFKGGPGEKFAVCNAGGGFAYVGAMHDSFPLALELSKKGYNAFALIYRPGAQTACEDLARAISFIFEHAEELEVSTDGYSLWGGSAGARMAANLGSYGTAAFGGGDWSRPATVVMQYTGHTDYTKNDPPTFAVVGESDGIASWRTMEQRISNLKTIGIDAEFRHYPGLGHGFGLGMETVAEGWVDEAVEFWEEHS